MSTVVSNADLRMKRVTSPPLQFTIPERGFATASTTHRSVGTAVGANGY